jgi:nitrite reductase/ring-hydroxylating ferredoxin subunit
MARGETNEHGGQDGPCDGCALVDRRNFLRDASLLAAGVLVTLGATPRHASAAPMGFTSAREESGEDKTYPIPASDGTQIDKDTSVIVARWQDKVYVFSLACPHQNTAIRWHDKEHEFECPKHHSRYLADGAYVKDSGRATRGLDRFAVRKDGNNVVADLDKLYREDEDETPWKSAFIAL